MRDLARRSWSAVRRKRPSSLVHRILSLQLAITAAVGVLALVSLAWTSQAIVQNNLSRWAAQWTSQLNELGAPFYVSDQSAALLSVERFVATYPEVAYVTWYEPDGTPRFSVAQQGLPSIDAAPLTHEETAALAGKAATETPHSIDEDAGGAGRFRLTGPIWTESIVGDGLMSFEAGESTDTETRVLGFVDVELDYSWYREQLVSTLGLGSVFLLGVLGISWAAGRRVLKKSLQPLSALEQPLAELAEGNMQVRFEPSRHEEIQNIITTLENTTAALEQRDRHLYQLATRDSLTGLSNRNLFVEELTEEITRLPDCGEHGAVLFIDLDQFKYINDMCGHPAGDELLQLAARGITRATRSEDLVARFGGDEFTVLARGLTREQVRDVGLHILEQMRLLKQIQNEKVFHIQCSIGVAMLESQDLDPHDYLAQADIACHAAKTKGRNRLEFYQASDEENQQMSAEIEWVQTVRNALAEDRFVLLYQPQLHLPSGDAEHYEVLLRLRNENGDLVAPDRFLPAATRFGLLDDIDRWVVARALSMLARFRASRPDLRFSINLSASVFDDEAFGDHVEALLREHGIPPQAVIFEITEQVAIRFAAKVDAQLTQLRELGCRFAIDDFGKGYSAFNYLKDLDVQYLKIDGAFIKHVDRDPVDQTMVRAMGEIARAAGIETVAECVESRAVLDLLVHMGIDYAQGFYLARPTKTPGKVHARAAVTPRAPRRRRGA